MLLFNEFVNEKASGKKQPDALLFDKWKKLVNMTVNELKTFMESDEGKKAGLSKSEAKRNGIHSGRQSATWILKMLPLSNNYKMAEEKWSSEMWYWAGRQVSFISRMSKVKGDLYDKNGNKTRKHLALLIWGHNPEK